MKGDRTQEHKGRERGGKNNVRKSLEHTKKGKRETSRNSNFYYRCLNERVIKCKQFKSI